MFTKLSFAQVKVLDIVSNHHIDLRSFGILILYAVGSLIVVYCIRHFKRANKIYEIF